MAAIRVCLFLTEEFEILSSLTPHRGHVLGDPPGTRETGTCRRIVSKYATGGIDSSGFEGGWLAPRRSTLSLICTTTLASVRMSLWQMLRVPRRSFLPPPPPPRLRPVTRTGPGLHLHGGEGGFKPETGGGRGLEKGKGGKKKSPVPNKPYGLCGR